jgi:signal transduction histidine kinase
MTLRARIGRRWRSISFRSGLLSALSVGVVASLAFFMLTVLVFTLFALTGAVSETSLVDRAEDQLLLGVDPADLNLESTLDTLDRPRGEGNDAFWVVLSGGDILNSDGQVNQQVLQAEFTDNDFAAELEAPQRPNDLLGIKTVGDQEWFYFERQVVAPDGSTYQVVTAYDGTFSLWEFAKSSFPVTIPILLVLMGVAMAVSSWLTRRALRRVEHMRAEVELITQQSLDRRVPTANASDGIEKLAHTMNDMLGRLESSTAQQTQFLADASHELRSPVAGLLAQLDVATAYPGKVDPKNLLPKLRGEAQRLQLLVDDLLFLSRSEASSGSTADEFTVVAVDALIAAEVAHQNDIDDTVNIVVGDPGGAEVTGNPRDLERALRNLVDNAVRHCENEVRIDAGVAGPDVVIRIADDGPGIAAEDEERIFKRFVRLDEARTRDDGGSGLGLAIASEIAANHHGSIRLAQSVTGGATFELTLPGTGSGST